MGLANEATHTRISKFLSYVLRHAPQSIGLALDESGWVDVTELLERSRKGGTTFSRELLEEIVATSPKKRFAFSEDGTRIRASQGHTVDVDLAYAPSTPPPVLYHGTPERTVPLVRGGGLLKMSRHHVHLSPDVETAKVVGSRRGKPVILVVDAARMHLAGHLFYVTPNGVWLAEHVPTEYITFPDVLPSAARSAARR